MKRILLALSVSMLVLGEMCQEAFANGGVQAVVAVQRPVLFPRLALRRAAIVAPQAAVVVAPQAFIQAPLVLQPQAFVATQAFIAPQRLRFVAPQAFSAGCSSAAFFSH